MKSLFVILSTLLFSNLLLGQTNPLYIPPTLTGPVYNLNMQHGTYNIHGGGPSATMGYNGDILGPTLIMNAGDNVTLNVTNSIGEETTTHWHGFHVSPENDGGPHSVISPNQTWSPQFVVEDKASTYWYHPHLHYFTMKHVVLGLAGLIIVRDSEEAALNLPRTYGVDDFPLILQTKAMFGDEILYSVPSLTGNSNPNKDSTFLVNATRNASLDAPMQVNRFRILNGATHRVFNFGISDGSTFWQIASDGGLLNDPVALTRLRLAPGERAEILVDLSSYSLGSNITFMSYASEIPNGFWGAEFAFADESAVSDYLNPLNGVDFDMLTINVVAQTSSAVTSIPSALVSLTPISASTVDTTRFKYFFNNSGNPNCPIISSSPTAVEDDCFDINVINDYIELGNTEIWELHGEARQYHPFHIHDIQFFILERNGSPPPLNERGLKDVVSVGPGEVVKIIGKFEHFTGDTPYMYHCHILPHEDRGMMGQFVVRQNIYVDNNYTGVENGTMAQPFNTIREGVNVGAATGMTLNILSTGIHNEAPPDLLMNKKVNLIIHNPPVIIE